MMHVRRQHRSHAAPRRGVVTVEFALTAMILFLVIFAMIEFARFNMLRHGIDTAAYEGARCGMVPGATASEVQAKAIQLMTAVSAGGATVAVNPPVISSTTNQITVTVTVPIKQNGWIVPKFFKQSSISRSCTLAREKVENF